MKFNKLTRNFLAAFPVLGPHESIECELMLAGTKPVAWLEVLPDYLTFQNSKAQKRHNDRKILDRTVAEGRLLTTDIQYINAEDPDRTVITIRFYCQLRKENDMKKAVAIELEAIRKICGLEIMNDERESDNGHYFGYRKRDIIFYDKLFRWNLPELVFKLNKIFRHAYQDKILEESGTRFNAYNTFPPLDSEPS
jgi:uncharacterized protein YuzE